MEAFRIRISLFAAVGLLADASALARAEDARALLVRSLREGDSVPLSGEQVTSVAAGGGLREVVQLVRRKANRVRVDVVAPPGVRGQVMVDDGRLYRLYKPRLRLVEEGESRLSRAAQQRRRQIGPILRGKLTVREEPEETIAGRPTRVLTVTSPDGRRSRRLWLDREHAVPLKVEETGPGGQVVTTHFTRVDFRAVPPDGDFTLHLPPGTEVVPAGLGRPVPLPRAQAVAGAWGGLYQPRALPHGFSLRGAFVTRFKQTPVVALHYSDGSRSFTFFQAQMAGPHRDYRQDLTVVGRQLDGVSLTAVGSMPELDLRRALDSAAR